MPNFTPFIKYNKDQVILTSGRIIFNAKDDNIFFISNKDIAFSSGGDMHVNIGKKGSTTNKLIVNSPIIQFGLPDNKISIEPIAKGDSTVNSLQSLLNELEKLLNTLAKAKGLVAGGVADLTEINIAANSFLGKLPAIQKSLADIKSTITYSK